MRNVIDEYLSDSRSYCMLQFDFFQALVILFAVVCSSKARRFHFSSRSASRLHPCGPRLAFKWAHPSELSAADVRNN